MPSPKYALLGPPLGLDKRWDMDCVTGREGSRGMKAKKILSSLLIALLIWGYPLHQLYGSDGPSLAVVPLTHPESDLGLTQKMADRLREELSKKGGLRVLSSQETETRLASRRMERSGDLGSTLEEARRQYSSLEFEGAKRILHQKLAQIEIGGMTFQDSLYLVPSYLLLGTLHQMTDDTAGALKAFEEVIRLAPETVLDEKKHSPKVRELFNQAKAKVFEGKNRFGAFKVTLAGGKATLYLNGLPKGKTPLVVKGVPPGRHYLGISAAGSSASVSAVEVSEGKMVKVQLSPTETGPAPEMMGGISVSHLDRSGEIVSAASLAGGILGVDRVALLHAEKTGGTSKVTVKMVEMKRAGAFSQETVEVKEGGSSLKSGTKFLAAWLVDTTGLSPVVSPGEGPRTTRGASERPFWKRPIFWIIGGLILAGAGAGAGIGLAMGGGGSSEGSVVVDGGLPTLNRQVRR